MKFDTNLPLIKRSKDVATDEDLVTISDLEIEAETEIESYLDVVRIMLAEFLAVESCAQLVEMGCILA